MTLPIDLDTVHNPAPGTAPPVSWFQAVESNFAALLGPPACELRRQNLSVPNNTATAVDFTSEIADWDGMHDNAVNNDRATAQTAGIYLVVCHITPEAAASGTWSLRLQLNGSQVFRIDQASLSGSALRYGLYIPRFVAMNVGDWVRMVVHHTVGSTKNVQWVRLSAWRVAPLAASTAFTYADLDTIASPSFGAPLPAAWGDQVRTNFESLKNRPVCALTKSAAQGIPHETATSITFNGELTDQFGMHDNAVENQRITFKRAGTYLVVGTAAYEPNSTGLRLLALFTPFRTIYQTEIWDPAVSGQNQGMAIVTMVRVNVDDYLQMETQQRSGGSLGIQNDAQLGAVWLGE